VLLLVPLCCSLLEQPVDKQQCLAEQEHCSGTEAELRLAHRKVSWTFEVLSALHEPPGADLHISAIMSRSKINMSDFEL